MHNFSQGSPVSVSQRDVVVVPRCGLEGICGRFKRILLWCESIQKNEEGRGLAHF